ncbi:threonine aldolase family protein [Reyranella sp.]|uniref:threonine aldolase family protein n=1 Tax=Reyranella sp. TaxID=1929291 RepID=UPI003783FB6C
MPLHDFRSDTVTLPSPAMMAAIAAARLGDAARGDDPTVADLERCAREITGKDDALFVPSGTMANLAALLAHDCRGGEVIVEEAAHLYNSEGGGLSVVAGAVARPVKGRHGILAPASIEAAIRGSANPAVAPTRLVCLENTHNAAGGTVMPVETMAAIHDVARRAGIPVHLDGARLFNAAAHLEVPIGALCRPVDSLWFALCKGLGGPVGAILAGDAAFMRKARRAVRMLGGGMRQAGLIAAPALVALDDPYPAHRRDHALARRLACGLAAIDARLVDADRVQTNIVNCHVDDADDIARDLGARDVLTLSRGKNRIRFVTHSQVDEASVDAAVDALADILATRPNWSTPCRESLPT